MISLTTLAGGDIVTDSINAGQRFSQEIQQVVSNKKVTPTQMTAVLLGIQANQNDIIIA